MEHEEWTKKILAVSDVHKKEDAQQARELEKSGRTDNKTRSLFLLVFAVALIPRLIYIFVFSNPEYPGWYTDTYHHWQVGFLSKEVGFSHGFLRLWDFKGMEFFWGLLHPLVLSILFTITGSVSILVPRLLSLTAGSLSIVFLFILIKRYFNLMTAWAVVIFATFFPITLFSNTVGMQEELGMALLLGGMVLWPKKPVVVGILFGLAAMVRSEFWLFTLGISSASLLFSKESMGKRGAFFASYIVVILIYMKYLLSYTGNPIYPIYWNFLASVKGEWFKDLPIIGEKLLAKQISQGIFAFGVVGALVTIWKRPKYMLFLLLGFGNIIFIGFMVGFGAYVKGYITRFWVDRLYNWPYLFTGILIIISLFYYIPKIVPYFNKLKINWLIFLFFLIISQWLWIPIGYYMADIPANIGSEKQKAKEIAYVYQGGGILLPEDDPMLTYFLANDFRVKGKNMVGQMFDPFFYFQDKEQPFKNWSKDRKIVLNWLKENNIKFVVMTAKKPTYLGLFERESKYFEQLPSTANGIMLYRVKEIGIIQ